jgi:hypothetical protein|tara:strand:- start:8191 stop:8382 length:192 start_codon:yes stop_codon:yes gene_type:complete
MSDKKNLENSLNDFLSEEEKQKQMENDPNMDCSSGVCIIKGDKSLVERINKKIITEDGRQLLF